MVNTLIFFAEKNVSGFCIAKSTHIFCSKNINVFENTLATTFNKFVINKLVRLMMLEQLGPGPLGTLS